MVKSHKSLCPNGPLFCLLFIEFFVINLNVDFRTHCITFLKVKMNLLFLCSKIEPTIVITDLRWEINPNVKMPLSNYLIS